MRSRLLKIMRAVSFALILAVVSVLFYVRHPPDLGRLNETSKVVRGANGGILELRLTQSGHWREAVRLDDIDPKLVTMLIAYEDKRFWSHPGVDFIAVGRAILGAVSTGRIQSGASTLTMQTVRLIDPNLGRRNLVTKAMQMLDALRLDAHLSKTQILEAYFTLAPYGGNIEGIVAASKAWLEKPPILLTINEAALLVALPQSPERRRPDRFPVYALEAKSRVLMNVQDRLMISDQELAEYKSEGLPNRRFAPSSNAPHFADRFDGNQLEEVSALNEYWQATVSEIVRAHLKTYPNPINSAAIVVERRTGRVRAYVGAADYLSSERKGGVNYLKALRSPGSTLKPFIYAKALQLGLITPDEIFIDAPIQVDGYAPGNFDPNFTGEVSLKDALIRSLNIPAIQTLQKVGAVDFESAIATFLGHNLSTSAGLSLAVGGYYLTAEELVELYLEFADPEHADGLRFFESADSKNRSFLFDARSVNTVQNLLLQQNIDGRSTLFKTGTSHNRQDAWAVAITQGHIILAWLGTPDVEATQVLTGRSAAYPLTQKIINALGLSAPTKRADVISVSSTKVVEETCPRLIQFPENGEWIKADNLSISVSGAASATWYLNGKRLGLLQSRLSINNPGVQRITVKANNCIETIEIFVEVVEK